MLAQWACVVVLSIDFAKGAIYLIMNVYVGFNAALMIFPDSLMIMRTPLDFVQDRLLSEMSQSKQNSKRNWMRSKNETSNAAASACGAEAEIVLSHFQLSKYPDKWQRDEFEFLKFHKFSKIFD